MIPPGKLRCYVTGKLRSDRPEEHVRQRWARSLVEEYGYKRSDIDVEVRIKMGRASKRADIAVFKENTPHLQENALIIVEVKKDDVLPQSYEDGVDQLKSYMAASSSCRFGLWVGSEKRAYERLRDGSIESAVDIPRFGDTEPRIPQFSSLVAATNLKDVLRRCHNYIYANQGLQKAEAFHELVKLIFSKVYDETESAGPLQFYVQAEERKSAAGQQRLMDERIAPLFLAVKDRYKYIFPPWDTINLKPAVLAYICAELQPYSLLRTEADVKGAAYEELVGSNLRGDRGEYFTPRNVCEMAIRIVFSMFSERNMSSVRILDPCCGTGGFLVSVVNYMREVFTKQETAKGGNEKEITERVKSRIREIATQSIFGIDINPLLVRACQMNLVMHGDGSANVFDANSLYLPGEWDNAEAVANVGHGKFDVVFTNPPFGDKAIVDDPHVLHQFELSSASSSKENLSLPAVQLLVEAAWKFLKPGGILAIVLPDSILNNPSLLFIRRWLLSRTRIIASVDLPKETFSESRGAPNPSVLVVQRLTNEEVRLAQAGALEPNEIFMAIPRTVGRDKRGNPIFVKTPEGMDLLDENNETQLDDELPIVTSEFITWNKGTGR